NLLDLESIRPGAASHAYRFNILPDRVLEFTFDDILLPDSTTNEVASHGFVHFKIDQAPDLPIGSQVENQAAIYFDFNDPVLTNTTLHEIGEQFVDTMLLIIDELVETESVELGLQVFPNPFSSTATVEVVGMPAQMEGQVRLFDWSGRLLQKAHISETRFELEAQQLTEGVYLLQVEVDGMECMAKLVLLRQ
ncbi:MAG: T9SS type A sorting domain-containing protein, partial [Phaeodactylibacter sp.]|nr:T9SS type A sorting domain-containing protein [Phaeodactylibacter sp.]